ncbi:MAG TPA: NDMA-dependent alcohol dehydrogenase [Acidimicrobiales bacterium]|nr:NDMA-dependent alcohol dehydrogenase [Acidimicrobiales bacterium]
MRTRAAVCSGTGEMWKVEEIEIDPPAAREVQVQMAYAGMCHSDEHLREGNLTPPPEVLEMLGVSSMFPVVGGHEGAGVVTAVGPEVTQVAVGDHVAVAFIPACGTCFWCASGRQNLCDLGITTLCGPMISDGTWRYHLEGRNLNRMCQLGTFAEWVVCHEASLVKIDPAADLRAAALISCGIATGFGAAVERGRVRPGEVVVVAGCGGVGSGAVQGARLAGARSIVAVDPLHFKRVSAMRIGATHSAATLEEAVPVVAGLTEGRMADVVVLTPGTLTGELLLPACSIASKDGRIVVTALAPFNQVDVKLNLFNVAMWNQSILGTVFGSVSPRVQTPRLLSLHSQGLLHVDELITREYDLASVQEGYDDLRAGRNIRGVVRFGPR